MKTANKTAQRKSHSPVRWQLDETRILSRREVADVLADLAIRCRRSLNSRMNRVIFAMSAFCGLRVSEICGLELRDVRAEIDRPDILIRGEIAKRGRRRNIPLWRLGAAREIIAEWKQARVGQGAKGRDPFVASLAAGSAGRRLVRQNAARRWKTAVRCLPTERTARLSIHDGRHTCASLLLAAGWPLPNVQKLLGHSNIATTAIYLHALPDDDALADPFAAIQTAGQPARQNARQAGQTPAGCDLTGPDDAT
jgi:integrase